MLLPGDHTISKLVVKDSHKRVFHAGRERTLCEVRRRFWIARGRNLVRKTVKKLREPLSILIKYKTILIDTPKIFRSSENL